MGERSWPKGPDSVGFHLYEMHRVGKSTKTESGSVVTRGWERQKGQWLLMGVRSPFRVMKKVRNQIGVMVAQHHECT